ncbi:putative proteasome subunit beta type-2 [Astathelohania contejeani]|uniref:Proteasome subunit beta n=1 Tax=Astathelohania contejeani TaxID=164912 RepID=A0ABQ7I0Y3_9MICR|nr:putative proteasome subunit beta type-2 [Thelohania contejeani]
MIIKTGTTIVGLKYREGIVLAADTRATAGPVVADKNCSKIHKISDNIFCCGAGTAADTDRVTGMVAKELKLYQLKYGRIPRVAHAARRMSNHLHAHNGIIGAALILGGVDETGIHLYEIYPHGSTSQLKYATLGSGSLAAMSALESGFRLDMEQEDAIQLASTAVRAGILNDLYSGSNIDICIIGSDESNVYYTDYRRNYEVVGFREPTMKIKYPKESIKVISYEIIDETIED